MLGLVFVPTNIEENDGMFVLGMVFSPDKFRFLSSHFGQSFLNSIRKLLLL